jgi:two-component system sensor histidine kinase AgrC
MDFFIFFFYSIPEMFLVIALIITFAGYNFSKNKTKVLFISVLLSFCTEFFRLIEIYTSIRLFLQLFIVIISLKLTFGITFVRSTICSVISLLILQMIELVSINASMMISHKSLQELQGNFLLWIFTIWANLVILSFLLYIVRKYNFSIFNHNKTSHSINLSFTSYLMYTTFFTFGVIGAQLLTQEKSQSIYAIIAIFMFQAISILMVNELIKSRVRETELSTYKEYMKDINSLFTTIRAQRHDFSNHIQVLYIFSKQGEYEKLLYYIEQLVGQIKSINQILISDNPGLSALLQTKVAQFEQEGISIKLDIDSTLTDINVPIIELNQIIGNLLDNAADAIKSAGYPINEILLQTIKENDTVQIKVKNYRPVIPVHLQSKIFEYGFSTKSNHSGLGLAIISDLVQKNRGTVSLVSNEVIGTEFTITFPIAEVRKIEQKTS